MRTIVKNRKYAQGLAVALSAAMALSALAVPTEAAAKKAKLSTTKVTVTEGQKKKVTVKNASKVTWKVTSGKSNISLSKKSKKGATILGKKKGSAKVAVTMKSGKKRVKKTIKVTVKAKKTVVATATATATPVVTATATPVVTATPTPTATATAVPTPTPRSNEVKNIEITYDDFQAAGIDADFGSACAIKLADEEAETPYNLLKDKDDRFDLKYFESVTVELEYDLTDEDTSAFNGGKVAICTKAEDVDGYKDGDKLIYGVNADTTEYTLEFGDEELEGQCAGLNIQAWDGNNNYASPECLGGITIKKITFNAIPGMKYPTA